jgi:hypothetical protein
LLATLAVLNVMSVEIIPAFPSKTIWDSSVGLVDKLRTGQAKSRDFIPGRGKRFFSTPKRPDRLWSPWSLPFIVQWCFFLWQ